MRSSSDLRPRGSDGRNPFSPRKRVSRLFFLSATLISAAVLWLGLRASLPGFTRLELTDGATGKTILSAILRDEDQVTLTWHNSQFNLDVTEGFIAVHGALIQTEVTFADPRGLPPPVVAPRDVEDLYHTGGPFSAKGMHRSFSRIAYRVGEIGRPQMTIGTRVVDFKKEVGFGGEIVLTTDGASLADIIGQRLAYP